MAIKVTKQPDVVVTQEELNEFSQEYSKAYQYYSGPVPSLEEFIRRRKAGELSEDRKFLRD